MHNDDFAHFANLIDGTWELNPNWKPLSSTGKALFFKALAHQSIDAVQQGLTAHIRDTQRGRFQPMPSDILAQIEGKSAEDGRPGVEEAWAISLAAMDESETVVWTDEMCSAFWICKPILDQGDEVGARMAFKESYNRQVAVARKDGRPVKWQVTPGKNQERHQIVYQRNVELGRLPAPSIDKALLLSGPAQTKEKQEEGRARLLAEVAKLVPPSEKLRLKREAELQEEMQRVAARKQELNRQEESLTALQPKKRKAHAK
jgi:hypothetical protein